MACIGNGHPAVKQAIKDQVDKLSCELASSPLLNTSHSNASSDVYNMQLSNEPAEELAQLLIDESKGAFSLCGFVCGGNLRETGSCSVLPMH